ncbi:MAG TPA: 5'-nucleotidase C-terminal domain-containing protein [Marmoricola sp.]
MCEEDIGATVPPRPSRRALLTGAAALAAAGFITSSNLGCSSSDDSTRTRLTILGTADSHGRVYNWDYFHAREYDDAAHDDIGLAKVATLMAAVRKQRSGEPMLTLDAGDIIEGTPLASYYGAVHPAGGDVVHPMALAMNLMGYDAAAVGNHEFNYGLTLLRTFESQVNFPMLGANAHLISSGGPAFTPYIIKTLDTGAGPSLKVGILGLTNPAALVWNPRTLAGHMTIVSLIEQAKVSVPELKKQGCDVVVVVAHGGLGPGSSYGDALPYPDNVCLQMAAEIPDIDVILSGHTHQDIPQRLVKNTTTGRTVLINQPYCWGKRLGVIDVDLEHADGHWKVVSSSGQNLNTNTVAENTDVVRAVQSEQQTVLDYLNVQVATGTAQMSTARATVEDSPIIDLINHVQAAALAAALPTNTLPVLSIAPVLDTEVVLPKGPISRREFACVYQAWDELSGIVLTGAQLHDYLEYDAGAYHQLDGRGPHRIADVFGAATRANPKGVTPPNFDAVAGLTARLRYAFDLSRPPGSRVRDLTYAGKRVAPGQRFAVAIGTARRTGSGGFPHVATAPLILKPTTPISELLLAWLAANPVIDPTKFASDDWHVVVAGRSLRLIG